MELKAHYYYYYSIHDPKKEPIDKVVTTNLEQALEYFASRKKISKKMFSELFKIEQYEPK